jgi:hypothetical protein
MEHLIPPTELAIYHDLIDAIEDGTPISRACAERGVRMTVLFNRVAQFPILARRFAAARAAEAEIAFEKIAAKADELNSIGPEKDSFVPAAKAAIDTYRWVAERKNPAAFAPKSEATLVHVKAASEQLSVREKLELFAKEADALPAPDTTPEEEDVI